MKSGVTMLEENTTFEKHYSIGELAHQWGLGRETVRKLVKDDPGVVKVRLGPLQTEPGDGIGQATVGFQGLPQGHSGP